MLHLLHLEGVFPSVQEAITGYLKERRNVLVPGGEGDVAALERVLVDSALGAEGDRKPKEPLAFLGQFEHFTSPRKRFMFHAMLTELGVLPSDRNFDVSKVRYDGYASWVNLEMCALKIIDAYNRGAPELATAADRAFLVDQLSSGSVRSVFEADLLAHLLGLLAIRRISPDSPLVARGIDAMLRCHNPDGGFPFIAGWEPFLTAAAGLALQESGADHRLIQQMGDYVALHQGADGGWPFAPGVTQSDADCSPYCLEFLRTAGAERFAEEISRAEDFLRKLANDDGGFATYFHGDTPEVGVTGSAISALAPARDKFADVIDNSIRYLIRSQRGDGTFERGWSLSNANSILRSIFAFNSYPSPPTGELAEQIDAATERSLGYLVANQNRDGGWGQRAGDASDVLSTSYSLLVLSITKNVDALRSGLDYMLEHQGRDGGYVSIPDSAGPRPMTHDAPILADIFALLAVSHLLA
ncbi:prenyltransferase/squalene oxidase repeat-containing protein [Dactylosporangium sp. NPDC005572]|uniref:prenyltransferase/squalene oxidase repeat-containing protein n=1 Tax=Dactylosporangium sp. NPDC005572 TaxID=3156889 RepID=UPI0033A725C4